MLKKHVFYLRGVDLDKVQTAYPIIRWVYRWKYPADEGKMYAYSTALKELTEKYYWEN
jgi:hypothetical protein